METPRSKQHWGNTHNSMYSKSCNGIQSKFSSNNYMYTKLKDSVVSDRKKIKFDIKLYAPYFCVCDYTSRSITLGSSIARLMSIKNVTASRPSISLWSYVKASIIIGRITIWNYKILTTYTFIHAPFQGASVSNWHCSYKCRVVWGKQILV